MHQPISITRSLSRLRRASGLVVVAVALVVGATACEPATTVLDIAYADGRGGSTTYTVRCGPDQASITPAVPGLTAARACEVAEAETALLVDGPPTGRVCAQQYHGPETARVTGSIDGAAVDRRLRRNDSCVEGDWRRLTGLVVRPAGAPRSG